MALYPLTWQIECDICGDVAQSGPALGAQEIFVAALRSGWSLQATNDPPLVIMRCATCTADHERTINANDNGDRDHERDAVSEATQ